MTPSYPGLRRAVLAPLAPIVTLLAVLLGVPAVASAPASPTAAKGAPKQPVPQKMQPRGKFDVRLLATVEPEKVFHPVTGKDGKMSPAAPATVVERGKKVTAVIFIKDCAVDPSGNCNVDVDLMGADSTGKIFENRRGADLWKNRKAPAAGIAQLGSSVMNIQLEASDPVGTYRISVTAHDRVSGTQIKADTLFEVK